jgi:hypothetical protein
VTAEQSSVNNITSFLQEKLHLNRRFDRTRCKLAVFLRKEDSLGTKEISYSRPRSEVKTYFLDVIGVKRAMDLVESSTILIINYNYNRKIIEFGEGLTL